MNKPKWMLTVKDCRGDVQEKINNSSYGEACEIIGDTAQHKLMEYLHDVALTTPEAYRSPKSIISKMLKELEANQ